MLTTLRIRNLALVEDLTLELQPGYSVITGETGAGKSILIGALGLTLGERADRTLIRDGADACSVEAVFDVSAIQPPINELLRNHGLDPCEEAQLVIKRTCALSGANRQFVNGSPTPLGVLSELGEWLVDIHGPHDHQSLLHPSKQLTILDSFGNSEADRESFAGLVRRRAGLEDERAALIIDEKTYLQQLELLRFQVAEIAQAQLEPQEDLRIEQQYTRASNSARLLQLTQAALDLLGESELSLLTQAGALGRTLQELQRLDSTGGPLAQTQEQLVELLGELQSAVSQYAERIELDPVALQRLEERLNLLQNLKRKYGPSLSEVIAFGDNARRRLETLEQRDLELARLNTELKKAADEVWVAGEALSARRRKSIPGLTKAVNQQLSQLGFKQSRFEVNITSLAEATFRQDPAVVTPQGLDRIEFQFAPNPGEAARPLRAIASSGELARVMLALKTVLAAQDWIPVVVFDEVDANVGGETAHAVARKMKQIAHARQVLCITHLPQVAALASNHFVVTKEARAGRTVSQITLLDQEGRVTELARMLGGQNTPARKHAEALLKS